MHITALYQQCLDTDHTRGTCGCQGTLDPVGAGISGSTRVDAIGASTQQKHDSAQYRASLLYT